MILAAGVGSRLDPLTRTTPKPMVPVLGVPVMTHIIHLLKAHGFTDIIANTHYLADVLEDHYKAHPVEGVSLTFNREAELLGTAGGLKRVQDQLGFFDSEEPFLVVGGDDLTAINLTQMLEFHRKNGAIATIGLTEVEDPSQFGVVVLNGDNIERFVEKPAPGTAPSNTVNMGVYLFSPQILNHIPSGEFYDFGKNVFPEILEADQPFCGFVSKDYWRDVGNLREYRDVQGDFFEGLVELQTGLSKNSDGNYLGEGVEIDANAQIEAPVSIGAGSKIGAGARLGKGSILGQNVVVGENATIEKSILWDGAKIGTGTFLSGSIVGYDVEVSSSAGIFGAVVVPAKK